MSARKMSCLESNLSGRLPACGGAAAGKHREWEHGTAEALIILCRAAKVPRAGPTTAVRHAGDLIVLEAVADLGVWRLERRRCLLEDPLVVCLRHLRADDQVAEAVRHDELAARIDEVGHLRVVGVEAADILVRRRVDVRALDVATGVAVEVRVELGLLEHHELRPRDGLGSRAGVRGEHLLQAVQEARVDEDAAKGDKSQSGAWLARGGQRADPSRIVGLYSSSSCEGVRQHCFWEQDVPHHLHSQSASC